MPEVNNAGGPSQAEEAAKRAAEMQDRNAAANIMANAHVSMATQDAQAAVTQSNAWAEVGKAAAQSGR